MSKLNIKPHQQKPESLENLGLSVNAIFPHQYGSPKIALIKGDQQQHRKNEQLTLFFPANTDQAKYR